MADQGQPTSGLQPLLLEVWFSNGESSLPKTEGQRLSCTKYFASKRAVRTQLLFPQKSFAEGEVEGIQLQFSGFGLWQRDAHGIALHYPANTRRNVAKQVPEFQIRDNAVIKFEEQLEPILLMSEFQVKAQHSFVGLFNFI